MGLVTSSVGIDENMIKTFAESGCKGLLIGFESITQESQSYINKGINKVTGYEEDTSVFERTVEAVVKAKIDLPRYSILTSFPKTQFYTQLEAENRIFEKNWAMYDVEHCVFTPKK